MTMNVYIIVNSKYCADDNYQSNSVAYTTISRVKALNVLEQMANDFKNNMPDDWQVGSQSEYYFSAYKKGSYYTLEMFTDNIDTNETL